MDIGFWVLIVLYFALLFGVEIVRKQILGAMRLMQGRIVDLERRLSAAESDLEYVRPPKLVEEYDESS
jgi:hypothetical protein